MYKYTNMHGLLSICTTGGGSSILDHRDQALKAGLELHPWECGKSWVVVGVSNWGMRTLSASEVLRKPQGFLHFRGMPPLSFQLCQSVRADGLMLVSRDSGGARLSSRLPSLSISTAPGWPFLTCCKGLQQPDRAMHDVCLRLQDVPSGILRDSLRELEQEDL